MVLKRSEGFPMKVTLNEKKDSQNSWLLYDVAVQKSFCAKLGQFK